MKVLRTHGLFIVLFLFGYVVVQAGSTPDTTKKWSFEGKSNLNFSQVSFSNWAAGGNNSIAGNSFIHTSLHYNTQKISWENTLDVAYGLVSRQTDNQEMTWQKSDDRIDFSSKLGKDAFNDNFLYSTLLSFSTQLAPGYKNINDSVKISDFMAPAYLMVSMGLDYKYADQLSVYLAPLTGKMTIVNSSLLSEQGSFGVEKGKKQRLEAGGSMKIAYNYKLMKNIALKSNLKLFSNYLEEPQNIDIEWQVFLNLRVNEYIAANINTHLIYDDDIMIADESGDLAPRIQFKEILGVGLSYDF